MSNRKTAAFTLVELVVVITIIGVMVAFLLPAIQAAREAARRSECKEHLRQLAIAALNHSVSHGCFPTGGWGHGWTGDPDRGFRRDQPGGWVYNILPFVEERALRDRGLGLPTNDKKAAAREVIATPLAILNCPSRRPAIAYPFPSSPFANIREFYNTRKPDMVARADYAANCGDRSQNVLNDVGGPTTMEIGDTTYLWPNRSSYTGICFVRSEVNAAKIVDGTTKTYLIGEKYLNPELYETGEDPSDLGHMFVGHGAETLRIAKDIATPRQDLFPITNTMVFGSAHAGSFHMAFCDGSVRAISYDIQPIIHQRFGNRHDNEIVIASD